MIAAVHAVLTAITLQALQTLAWGPIQFRVSEALTVIALFTPAAIPGLALGCALANLLNVASLGPIALLDVVFGSVATGLGAAWTWKHRSSIGVALLGPVIANAVIVPAYLPWLVKGLGLYRVPSIGIDLEGMWVGMYLFGMVAVAIGEAVVVYAIGAPIAVALRRRGLVAPDVQHGGR